MYEAYRVKKPFHWRGWHYGPTHVKNSVDPVTGNLEECDCPYYAGDIWIVEAGHPRKEMMFFNGCIRRGNAELPPVDELLAKPEYKRLLTEPGIVERELVTAGRGPGRPRK